MIFDKNQTEFKDCIQERVWELCTRQVPLKITLPFIPDELKPACIDWYNFNKNLFADMYKNPDRFGFKNDLSHSNHVHREKVSFIVKKFSKCQNYKPECWKKPPKEKHSVKNSLCVQPT